MKNGKNPSRAQFLHRQSFVAQTEARRAQRKRRRKLGHALDLPTAKAEMRKLAHGLTIGKLLQRRLRP